MLREVPLKGHIFTKNIAEFSRDITANSEKKIADQKSKVSDHLNRPRSRNMVLDTTDCLIFSLVQFFYFYLEDKILLKTCFDSYKSH